MGPKSPKMLQKLILPENVVISYFWDVEMYENCTKVAILANFRTPHAFYDPLKHQRSTSMGPESPKMLHKLILPENVVISYFWDVEMYKICTKFIISINFDQFLDPSHLL